MSKSTSSKAPFLSYRRMLPASLSAPSLHHGTGSFTLPCPPFLTVNIHHTVLRTYSISLHGAEPRPLAGWADNYYVLACAGLNAIDATECYHLDDQTRAGALPEARPASVSSPMLFPGTRPCPDNQH